MHFIDNSAVRDTLIRSLSLLEKEQKDAFILKLVKTSKPISIGFINQHAYNLCCQQPDVANHFNSLTYRLRDGSGVKFACQFNHCQPGANFNGTDFIPLLINNIVKLRQDVHFFIFGTEEPWLSSGARRLLGNKTFTTINGFEADSTYIEKVSSAKLSDSSLKVIVLAMGMPKQERIAKQIIAATQGSVIVICGGAVIDFCANRFPRAPILFRRTGMEWLYRLSLEPGRLFKRYVIGIPIFFYFLAKNKFFAAKNPSVDKE